MKRNENPQSNQQPISHTLNHKKHLIIISWSGWRWAVTFSFMEERVCEEWVSTCCDLGVRNVDEMPVGKVAVNIVILCGSLDDSVGVMSGKSPQAGN